MSEDIKPEVVQKTQKTLGKYVKKPPLTDKLLKKPPFRFLHDILKAVIAETGFLKGLYSDEELNSENVKDRDAKVAFLTKLIEAIKTIVKVDLKVKPNKIVAGLEPTETNLLLQAIAKALDRKLDSSDYVKQLHNGEVTVTEKKKTKRSSDKDVKKSQGTTENTENKDKKQIKTKEKQRTPSIDTPKSTNRTKSKVKSTKDDKIKPDDKAKSKKSKIKEPKPPSDNVDGDILKENKPAVESPRQEPPTFKEDIENKPDEEPPHFEEVSRKTEDIVEIRPPEDEGRKRSVSATRPKSARPKSGDLEKNRSTPPSEEPVPVLSNTNIRPKSSLRPPSVRPSSARPGAPRLRPDSSLAIQENLPVGRINVIVENFDKDGDDEETVVIHTSPDVVDNPEDNLTDIPKENKGRLVEEILEQINEDEEKGMGKTEIDWQDEGMHRDSVSKETSSLRSLIQTLTKTANPLGKLLSYVHEDIEAMQAELETWTKTKRQLLVEISKEKKITTEFNKPLLSQLDNLHHDIKKLEDEIANIRANILRNDARINELATK